MVSKLSFTWKVIYTLELFPHKHLHLEILDTLEETDAIKKAKDMLDNSFISYNIVKAEKIMVK